ncbi:hypothetical protein K435DRAFT_853019 [Dendrothele bispora CBS 962.96]|uniref:Uncharacterized protein n=1 Tax=Dendrothele bispora (strain CBS 962.96) TaxID=1314807 RepID=A0A4S8MHQ0_DENBC|nr:hypothetical protein K435DRAFT_853019 [Dendrothele bispora CBS 962.96]
MFNNQVPLRYQTPKFVCFLSPLSPSLIVSLSTSVNIWQSISKRPLGSNISGDDPPDYVPDPFNGAWEDINPLSDRKTESCPNDSEDALFSVRKAPSVQTFQIVEWTFPSKLSFVCASRWFRWLFRPLKYSFTMTTHVDALVEKGEIAVYPNNAIQNCDNHLVVQLDKDNPYSRSALEFKMSTSPCSLQSHRSRYRTQWRSVG